MADAAFRWVRGRADFATGSCEVQIVAKAAKAFDSRERGQRTQIETLARFATLRYRGSNLLLSIGASSGAEPSGVAMTNVP